MFGRGSGFTGAELAVFRRLTTPARIQGFLNELACNWERDGETCRSPRAVLRAGEAHCVEGALLAAAALRLHGHRALVVELVATADDDSHLVAVWKERGCWGAIGKTNHAVLRYREPVYRDTRELVMSFFHEYFLNANGKKTLRSFTRPVDLGRFDRRGWMTAAEDLWYIPEAIEGMRHYDLLAPWQIRRLRPADDVEIRAGEILVDPEPGPAARGGRRRPEARATSRGSSRRRRPGSRTPGCSRS
jgi:hypothetical protein